jgi:hypothetical protein
MTYNMEHRYEVSAWWQARLGLESCRAWLGEPSSIYDLIVANRRLRRAETEMLCLELLQRIDSGDGMWPVGNQKHWE